MLLLYSLVLYPLAVQLRTVNSWHISHSSNLRANKAFSQQGKAVSISLVIVQPFPIWFTVTANKFGKSIELLIKPFRMSELPLPKALQNRLPIVSSCIPIIKQIASATVWVHSQTWHLIHVNHWRDGIHVKLHKVPISLIKVPWLIRCCIQAFKHLRVFVTYHFKFSWEHRG